jgi:hypothetical protein
MSNKTCTENDCTSPVKARGLCQRHYVALRRAGDPRVTGPKPPKGTCEAADCNDPKVGRQPFCNKHYQRVLRNGDLNMRTTGPKPAGGTTTARCARCRKTFKASARQRAAADAGRDVFCSRDCQTGAHLTTVPCAACGKDVTRRLSDLPESGRAYCGQECRDAAPRARAGADATCPICGTEFYVKPGEAEVRKTCSTACAHEWQRRHRVTKECATCSTEFVVRPSEPTKFCSVECATESRRAKVGDRYVNPETGYAWVYVAGEDGTAIRVQEHRHVMEQHIGRALYTWETVHHLTGGVPGRSNNDLSNLELWASRHPYGHRAEDLAAYCRQMLSLYGDDAERARYADQVPAQDAAE